MSRALTKEFLNSFLEGELSGLLDLVKKDKTLDCELRGDEVIIYYKGLKLLAIKSKNRNTYTYEGLDKEYAKRKNGINITLPVLENNNWKDYVIKAKDVVDTYDMKSFWEYEIKQQIVYENNVSPNAVDTDFFIIDMEYQNKEKNQFDIIALHYNSTRQDHQKGIASIAIIEIKQGNTTLKTTAQNPGIRRHLEDFKSFINSPERNQNFISEMREVLMQKCQLGLIKDLSEKTIKKLNLSHEIEFYVVLANYKKASTNLSTELNSFPDDCLFFTSSFMGYGLYNEYIKNKKEILEHINQ